MEFFRKLFNFLNLSISISVIGTLVWWHGFQYQPHHLHPHILYLNLCFLFFILQFLFRAKLSGDFKTYFQLNRIEYLLFMLLLIEWLMSFLLDFSILKKIAATTNIENHDHLYMLLLHAWLLLFVGIELGKATTRNTLWKLSPPVLFILSFTVLTVIGSSLLMLPEMTVDENGLDFSDALFTSISANCVTGLIVVDTATFFSLKGKILLLLMIQIGGLNIITFATYFISFFRRTISKHKHRFTVKELLHTDKLTETKELAKKVVITTLFIEFIGTVLLYQQWGSSIKNGGERLFYAVFHSVSAFNNAGFSLFTNGFANESVQNIYPIHITIAVLIVLGGIGFTTLQDIFNLDRIGKLLTWKKTPLPVQSKIAVYSSVLLIVLGAIFFFSIEKENILSNQSFLEKISTSIFQSITARTAGFNTVDFGSLGLLSLSLIMVLMFIGASSGSTGGGIKTSTFTTLVIAVLKRKERPTNYGKSFLTKILVQKAVTITVYSLIIITVGTVILLISDADKKWSDLLFEEISAFGTVGLSTGITRDLSLIGKSVIMVSMFIGRIGPLALAYTLIKSTTFTDEKEEQGIMIG